MVDTGGDRAAPRGLPDLLDSGPPSTAQGGPPLSPVARARATSGSSDDFERLWASAIAGWPLSIFPRRGISL